MITIEIRDEKFSIICPPDVHEHLLLELLQNPSGITKDEEKYEKYDEIWDHYFFGHMIYELVGNLQNEPTLKVYRTLLRL